MAVEVDNPPTCPLDAWRSGMVLDLPNAPKCPVSCPFSVQAQEIQKLQTTMQTSQNAPELGAGAKHEITRRQSEIARTTLNQVIGLANGEDVFRKGALHCQLIMENLRDAIE